MTRTLLSRSNGQRSRSPGRIIHRRVGASGSCSGGRGNVLAVRNCCYVAVCSAARAASAPTGGRGAGAYRGGRQPTACYFFYTLCYPDTALKSEHGDACHIVMFRDATKIKMICDAWRL